MPEQIEAAGCVPARNAAGGRSTGMSWAEVEAADADVVLVACCGFDLKRNLEDACANAPALSKLRAAREGRVLALDGNRYFARPAQSLAAGAALVARCAHGPLELAADDLPEEGAGWCRVNVSAAAGSGTGRSAESGGHVAAAASSDGLAAAGVEAEADGEGWAAAHAEAVARGSKTYNDPATGYSVFTEVAHRARGKCCGSGCRHCCFDHANVRDRARKISRPAWLLAPPPDVASAAVLFWSGGKDSFLALRRLLADESEPEIVLLTTFDASERRVAHQDVDIASIVRQAEHLGLPLLGVPLDRASGESYEDSIAAGLATIRRHVAIERLCFGDLHLEHIRGWREEALSVLGADLHFPLWHADYEDLSADLRASGVPCDVSATTVDTVAVGQRFGEFETPLGLDAFGERGEFHTLARVWEVPRRAALGV